MPEDVEGEDVPGNISSRGIKDNRQRYERYKTIEKKEKRMSTYAGSRVAAGEERSAVYRFHDLGDDESRSMTNFSFEMTVGPIPELSRGNKEKTRNFKRV
jgi:hypothetical protein